MWQAARSVCKAPCKTSSRNERLSQPCSALRASITSPTNCRCSRLADPENSAVPAEEFALFDQGSDLRRHHLFPTGVAFTNAGQHVARENRQACFVHVAQSLDTQVLHQIGV